MIQHKTIVLVDRKCGFCSSWENFLKRHDRHKRFLFGDLSDVGNYIAHKEDAQKLLQADSLIVIDRDGTHLRSKAVRRIFRGFDGWVRLLGIPFEILPVAAGDTIYRFIARNRHRHDKCVIHQ